MQVKTILRKTQQGNNLDEELQSDKIVELQLLLFLLYFLHVTLSNNIQLILFLLQVEKQRNKEGKFDEDQKVHHQTAPERKRYVIFLVYST